MRSRSLAIHEHDDREVVGSIRAFEETEPLSVRPLFWVERSLRRAKSSAHTVWVAFLCETGVLQADPWCSRLSDAYGSARVPCWVNDLARVLQTSRRTYEKGGLSCVTREQAGVVRLVSRAVRAAQRAPAFRIALSAKCRELRAELGVKGDLASVEQAPAAEAFGKILFAWLKRHDWSDTRPGALFR